MQRKLSSSDDDPCERQHKSPGPSSVEPSDEDDVPASSHQLQVRRSPRKLSAPSTQVTSTPKCATAQHLSAKLPHPPSTATKPQLTAHQINPAVNCE